jgi:hypothetical protein
MADKKISLGQAIDTIVGALEQLDVPARQTAITAACTHLNIKFTENEPKNTPPEDNPNVHGTKKPITTTQLQTDIRALKEEKSPKSAIQMACVVAYYLQELAPENERKEAINTDDLDKYFKQAKFPLPKVISQLLPDAKGAGYFDSTSQKGNYILNAVGYNLVAHNLPPKSSK